MSSQDQSFTLITGASSGIGLELARLFARRNDRIILTARSIPALEALAEECRVVGSPRVEVIGCDLAAPAGANELVAEISRRNLPVDILVNNAGFGTHGRFWETDPAESDGMLQLNVVALASLTRALLPAMVARKRGKILNVASTAAFQPGPIMAGYYASKAFVLSFSEALSVELKRSGVTVTALCPGPTPTNFQKRAGIEHSKLFDAAGTPVEMVAREGFHGLMAGRRVVIPGWKNRLLAAASRFAPKSAVMRVVKKLNEAR